MERSGHIREVEIAFARQASSFRDSDIANADQLLQALLDAAHPTSHERWLDAACGPGIVARSLAGHAGAVIGLDATDAMVELARESAERVGVENVTFAIADATDTGLPASSFDGAVTRFSIHHIPVPDRLFKELARLVKPGGTIVVLDHVADEDADERSWVQEVERLRDPSHWASRSPGAMRTIAQQAGLTLRDERRFAFELDFDDWLRRGTEDPAAHELVQRALKSRPGGTARFAVTSGPKGRVLGLEMWLGTWSR